MDWLKELMAPLIEERKRQGISVEELAKLSDIPADIIHDLENGIDDEFCFLYIALIKCTLKNQADYNIIITTSKLVVCTAPIRGYYRLSLSKRH